MAAIVEFIGSRVATIDSADAGTNVLAVKMAGGGGSPSETAADTSIQGGQAVGMTYPAANRFNTLTYDIVTAGGTALNFSAGGANENQLLYVWANALFPMVSTGNVQDNAYGGLGITISDNANIINSWANFTFYGVENYPGGWVRLCIDPTLVPTSSGGTFAPASLSSIRKVGIFFVAGNNARSDALVLDAIDVGSGIRIYDSGTSDNGFGDLLSFDQGDSNNRYGVITSLEESDTVINILGTLEIGDPTGTTQAVFDDINKVIVIENPQYINSTQTAFVNSIPDEFLKIKCVGNTTSGTDITFGEKVGDGDEARGRNGLTFLGPSNAKADFVFNLDDNVDTLSLYGTTLRSFNPTGNLIWNTSGNHEFIGSTLDNCSRLEPDSGVVIRNCTFLNHSSNSIIDSGALLFTSNPPDDQVIDIKNCSFVANDRAIQHESSGTFTYDGFSFSDNTFDVFFSTGTASDLVVNVTNPVTPAASITATTGAAGSTVSFLSSFTLTITGFVNGSELFMRNATDGTTNIVERFNEESAVGSYEYTYDDALSLVDLFVLKATGDPTDPDKNNRPYQWLSFTNFSLPSTSQQLLVQQVLDRNYTN